MTLQFNNRTSDSREGATDVERINRSVTNKYWSGLFVVACGIWIASFLNVVLIKIDSQNNFDNVTESIKHNFQFSNISGKSWILDTIFCNVAFLSRHYENSGSIVILANVLFCTALLAYSLSSMRTDEMFYQQLQFVAQFFALITIAHRILICINYNNTSNWTTIHPFMQPLFYDGRLKFWLMPEVIFFMVCYTKCSYAVDFKEKMKDEMQLFQYFGMYVTMCTCLFTLPILSLFWTYGKFTMDILYESNMGIALNCAFLGISCYVVLTIFYFALMVMSCTIDSLINNGKIFNDDSNVLTVHPLKALITIGRYHFGTACYHATLILPRLETFVVSANDCELKRLPEFSKFTDRIYLTQFKLHNLSLEITAVRGSTHSESIRKLAHAFSGELPKLEYFQTFSQIARSLSSLLTSINSLIFIWLWLYGVNDPRFSSTTWMLYFFMTLIFTTFAKCQDVIWDTVMFYIDHESFRNSLVQS